MKFAVFSLGAFAASWATLVPSTLAQCESFGNDIADGGTYYFNSNSGAPFSYHGGFSGCVAETCTSSVQLPGGTSFNCDSISTTQTDYESTCALTHNQMLAGTYTIFIVCPNNGIEFGRAFSVTNTEATSTSVTTETATGTVTLVSTITSISTMIETNTVNLPAATITSPGATFGTVTIHPSTTVISTKTILHTSIVATTISTTSTKTKSLRCATSGGKPDTIKGTATPTPARRQTRPNLNNASLARKRSIARRDGPDGPLTTIITISASPVVVLTTAPATTTTVTSLTVVTTTTTITPPAQTTFLGTVPLTITAPTKTIKSTVRLQETSTLTVTRTVKFFVTVNATPTSC